MKHAWLQLVFLLLAVWMVLQLVQKYLGWAAILALVVVCALFAATTYMLRFGRLRLAVLYRRPGSKQFIDLVCWLTHQQPPIEADAASLLSPQIMLREARDFDWVAAKLKDSIYGQDSAIDQIVASLRGKILLRSRSPASGRYTPLGIYLLVGPGGIGKRLLARSLGMRLFREGVVSELNLRDYASDTEAESALFGTAVQEGHLLQPVRQRPYQMLILDDLEATGPRVRERLRQLLQSGVCTNPHTRSIVSFEHTVVVLTVSRGVPGLDSESTATMPPALRASSTADWLTSDLGLEPTFLSCLHETIVCRPPDELTKARVIAALMQQECRRFDLVLDYVEAEILAEEVAAYSDQHGFQLSKSRVARRLQTTILRAAENDVKGVVLSDKA